MTMFYELEKGFCLPCQVLVIYVQVIFGKFPNFSFDFPYSLMFYIFILTKRAGVI